jgi:outer membrane protein assembly factor BamA
MKYIPKNIRLIIFALLFLFFFQGCNYTPFLSKNEYLLNNQKNKGNRYISSQELCSLYKLRTNKKIPVIGIKPYLYFYLLGRKSFNSDKIDEKIVKLNSHYLNKLNSISEKDTSKIRKIRLKKERTLKKLTNEKENGNFLMRVLGEKPTYLDTHLINLRVKEIINLYKKSGFLDVKVNYKLDTNRQNVNVTYLISEGNPYRISQFSILCIDTNLLKVIENDKKNYIKKGDIYNENNLVAERDRITLKFRDLGYFDFVKENVHFEIDSSFKQKSIKIDMIIEKNNHTDNYIKYYIQKIEVLIDAEDGYYKTKKSNRNIIYYFNDKIYSPNVLDKKIAISVGSVYSNTESQKTLNRLNRIDMFRYSNLSYLKNNDSLVGIIRLNSMSRYRISDEFGVNTNINQQVPGPFGNIVFINRNTLRNCEIFEISARAGIEGQASATNPELIYQTTEASGNLSLTYPLILFPFVSSKIAADFDPRTKFIGTHIRTDRPEFFRSNSRFSLNYLFQTSQYSRVAFSLIDLNIIDAKIKDSIFVDRLKLLVSQGNNLINTFNRSIISYMGLNYTYNNNDFLSNKKSHYFRIGGELGGLTLGLIQNTFKRDEIPIQNDELFGLPFFKYIRIYGEFRKNNPISRKSAFAYRLLSGIVFPYDGFKTIPYDKYFFIGGSNSIRAWRPRRLGPGNYAQRNENQKIVYTFEQPGDIQLEFNMETRFTIYKFLAGALFMDAGNIWSIEANQNRPDANFTFDFNKLKNQIAIGTGFGIRFDFSFFIFRIDVGIKTFDPAQKEGKRWIIREFNIKDLSGKNENALFNFSVGYPF